MTILIPGRSSTAPQNGCQLCARSGWPIPVQPQVPSKSIEELRIKDASWRERRPKVILRSLSTYPYNCVGMIFAARRAFIDIEYIDAILKEDGYREITQDEIVPGDVVLYKQNNEPAHVALIMVVDRFGATPNVKVISKWGLEGKYEHFIDDVPENLGVPIEYYTDRQL